MVFQECHNATPRKILEIVGPAWHKHPPSRLMVRSPPSRLIGLVDAAWHEDHLWGLMEKVGPAWHEDDPRRLYKMV